MICDAHDWVEIDRLPGHDARHECVVSECARDGCDGWRSWYVETVASLEDFTDTDA